MISADLTRAIQSALSELGLKSCSDFSLEKPAVAEHGDWASNVALVNAKGLGKPPKELALAIAEILNRDHPAHISKAEVAGPGFLNLHLENDWLYEVMSEVLSKGEENFARHDFGVGEKILLEFVSANPTGPLHAGHAKGAVLGDTLARCLRYCGYEVKTEFYVNDFGAQVDLYAESLLAEIRGEPPPEDGYMGSYIGEWAKELEESGRVSASTDIEEMKSVGIEVSLGDQREILGQLDVHFDNWALESDAYAGGKSSVGVKEILKALEEGGLTYKSEGALWLRSAKYGDDKDRVLIKSDGSYTYLLPDIAYHMGKLARVDRLVNIWGADHHGYVARLRSALSALGESVVEGEENRLEIIICQLVRLESGGKEIKISKRSGDIILLRDLVEELGTDATRFTFLLQSPDSSQTVDLQIASAKSMDNPVYYVQYAHTRICSVAEKCREVGIIVNHETEYDSTLLTHPEELQLLKILSEMPDVVDRVGKELAPHKLTSYLRELAGAFHGFYHNCQVLGEDIDSEITIARLQLATAVQIGLKVGLNLCGVHAPEKM